MSINCILNTFFHCPEKVKTPLWRDCECVEPLKNRFIHFLIYPSGNEPCWQIWFIHVEALKYPSLAWLPSQQQSGGNYRFVRGSAVLNTMLGLWSFSENYPQICEALTLVLMQECKTIRGINLKSERVLRCFQHEGLSPMLMGTQLWMQSRDALCHWFYVHRLWDHLNVFDGVSFQMIIKKRAWERSQNLAPSLCEMLDRRSQKAAGILAALRAMTYF